MKTRLLLITLAMVIITICAAHKSPAVDPNNLPTPFDIVMMAGADYELLLNVTSPLGGAVDLVGNSYAAQFRSAPYPGGVLFATFSTAKFTNYSVIPPIYVYSPPRIYAFEPFSSAVIQCTVFEPYSTPPIPETPMINRPSGRCLTPYSSASGWVYTNASSWTVTVPAFSPYVRSSNIQLKLPGTKTRALSGKSGVWDLVQINILGKIRYMMGGKAMVRPTTTVLP